MNVLITSASRKIGLIRAFHDALHQTCGGKVIAVDTSPYAASLYLADDYFLVSPSDAPDFAEELLELCKQHRIKLIVPTRDEELPVFATKKDLFLNEGIFVMVSNPGAVKTCQDKKLFVKWCQTHGFDTPNTYELSQVLRQDVEFPIFVKPALGKGAKGVFRIDSKEQLQSLSGLITGSIVQEYIEGPEYTTDVFADFSGNIISAVPRRRLRIFGGESFVSQTHKNPVLIEEACRLSKALDLIGHNTIQCFLVDSCVKFIEVNPRYGGAANLGFAAGAPTPLFLIKLLLGQTVSPCIGQFIDGYVMLRYTEDLFLGADSLAKRHGA